jgi:tetratricopeptide (TPR) repeat protein
VLYEKALQEPVKGKWSPANAHPRKRNYWISYRDSTDLLYVQFNSVQNASPEWTIEDLADSLRAIADARPLDKVALDLRNNSGGNHGLIEPLVDLFGSHPKIDERGTLYVLLSRKTFSAAGTLAMELERRSKAFFVGEPGSFAPNMWGDTVPVLLPHSKLVGNVSYRYWQTGLPDDPRTRLATDITDAYVERRSGSEELALVWKDTSYTLVPVDSGFTLPTEDLRAGRFKQAAKRFRAAQASGFKLDSWITSALTARADTLEAKDRPIDALRYNQLAVELFPQSWRVYSSLAYNYELLGRTGEAISAYQTSRTLDPSRSEAMNERLRELKRPEQGKE